MSLCAVRYFLRDGVQVSLRTQLIKQEIARLHGKLDHYEDRFECGMEDAEDRLAYDIYLEMLNALKELL